MPVLRAMTMPVVDKKLAQALQGAKRKPCNLLVAPGKEGCGLAASRKPIPAAPVAGRPPVPPSPPSASGAPAAMVALSEARTLWGKARQMAGAELKKLQATILADPETKALNDPGITAVVDRIGQVLDLI